MTSVEILSPRLGDALIDVRAQRGAGFDECTLTDVAIDGDVIAFRIDSPSRLRRFTVRFRGIEDSKQYRIVWNGKQSPPLSGSQLIKDGFTLGPLD